MIAVDARPEPSMEELAHLESDGLQWRRLLYVRHLLRTGRLTEPLADGQEPRLALRGTQGAVLAPEEGA